MAKASSFRPSTGLRLVAIVVAVTVDALTVQAGGQLPDQRLAQDGRERYPNFDVRADKDEAAAEYRERIALPRASTIFADLASARAAGLVRLRAGLPGVEVINNPEMGIPEVISAKAGAGFLTAPTADRVGAMRAFLSTYADVYGLSQEQARTLDLVADYVNPAGNMAWVQFDQRVNGFPVFRGSIRGGFTVKGELARITGQIAPGLDATSLPTTSTLTPAQAVSRAAMDHRTH